MSLLTVVSHCGQKTFKIAVIDYCNMSVYVQQMMNQILWSHQTYLWAYVDDIVIYSVTLTEHMLHLQQIFDELTSKRICLTSNKFFLKYLLIQLLNQQVNALNLTTAEAKLVIITSFEFSCILTQLKKYFEMTNYLKQYILHYTAIIKSLQLCKTLLNQHLQQDHDKNAVSNKSKWKRLTDHISIVKLTLKELNVFHHLQILFSRFTIFSHFNSKHQLYIDLDVLKKFDFNIHIYHDKFKTNLTSLFSQKETEPILFLNCLLSDIKTQYWSTELEITDIVWMVKKM